MHELGIVIEVVKQVEELAKKNDVEKVTELTLEVGKWCGKRILRGRLQMVY